MQLDLTHWQVVWFPEYHSGIKLASAEGAIILTTGSPAGSPVRLVDTYTSDGIQGGELSAEMSQGSIKVQAPLFPWLQPATALP